MKHKIIRINTLSDINPGTASVYDLNNRYVDPRGNMYGLKYNWALKKVEVIKLVRAHLKDAPLYHQKMMRDKMDRSKAAIVDHLDAGEEFLDSSLEEFNEDNFNPESFIAEALSMSLTHKERLRGIMMNLNNSNVYPKENKPEKQQIEDIFRNIEIEGIQRIDKLENYQKELTSYPRSISYYQAKMDKEGRDIIEFLGGNKERTMRFIYLYEMYRFLTEIYSILQNFMIQLLDFISLKHIEDMKSISSFEKQSFLDAEVSLNNTIDEIDKLRNDLKGLGEYLKDADKL